MQRLRERRGTEREEGARERVDEDEKVDEGLQKVRPPTPSS